jgi:hypothetical protein
MLSKAADANSFLRFNVAHSDDYRCASGFSVCSISKIPDTPRWHREQARSHRDRIPGGTRSMWSEAARDEHVPQKAQQKAPHFESGAVTASDA